MVGLDIPVLFRESNCPDLDDPLAQEITTLFQGVMPSKPEKSEIMTFSERIAKRICSKHNKDAILLLDGERGAGKSATALEIARKTAIEIAKILGGEPDNFFNLRDNVSVITNMGEKMYDLTPHNVYIFDDAGPGYDARNHMSEENKDFNHIIQTCRTSNNFMIFTTPDMGFVDKQGRIMARYKGEIAESMHEEGYNLVKIFQVKRDTRQGKTRHMYFRAQGTTIKRFIAKLPPKEVWDEYDKIRAAAAKELMEGKAEKRHERESGMTQREKLWSTRTAEYGDEVLRLSREGLSDYAIGKRVTLNKEAVTRIRLLMEGGE